MPAAGIATLIAVALTVVVLAGYLITVAAILHRVSFTLGTIIAGLRSIVLQTQPLGGVIGAINKDLADTEVALNNLLARKSGQAQAAPGAPPRRRPTARAGR